MALRYGSKIASSLRYNQFSSSVLRYGSKIGWTSGGNEYDENATPAEYFTFAPLGDGTYSIKAKDVTNMPADVILPSTYNGKPVTKVADYAFINLNAFINCTSLTNIVIPDSITSIGNAAFVYCTNLTSVTLGSNLDSIDEAAFVGCSSLTSIVIPYSVTFIGYQTFAECPNLTIYCEAPSQPSDWDALWNINERPVIWGYVTASDSNYFTFTELSDGTYSIGAKDVNNLPDRIGIPSSYNEKAVTVIADEAFRNATTVTQVRIPQGVTTIGYKAFDGCNAMISIIIPNTVTTIGSTAFQSCTALTDVTLPSGITTIEDFTFFGCSSLTEFIIPDGVTSIGELAFAHNITMTNIIIPVSVDTMGSQVFFNCSNLTVHCRAASKPDGWVDDWDKATFYGDTIPVVWNSKLTPEKYFTFTEQSDGTYSVKAKNVNNLPSEVGIPSSYNGKAVTTIDNSAFEGATVAKMYIPDSITYIGSAFYSCSITDIYVSGLETWLNMQFSGWASYPNESGTLHILDENGNEKTNISIPNSYTTILSNIFRNARNITSIIIPNSVTAIGSYAFDGCSSLVSVVIPDSVTSIGDSAFHLCSSLTNVMIPDSVTSIGSGAFAWCDSLKNIEIPDSLTSIGDWAFSDCTSLQSVVIPDSVITIGSSAFEDCTSFTNIVIPNGVTSIGSQAFLGCTSLVSIVIPNSVTSIGRYAFQDCSSLKDIYITNIELWLNTSLFGSNLKVTSSGTLHILDENNNEVTNITIPSDVTTIPDYAFYNTKNITSVTIPDSVTFIGENAFYGCSDLKDITISNSVSYICYQAFSGTAYYNDESNWVDGVLYIGNHLIEAKDTVSGEYLIRDGTLTIGTFAFSGCTNLTSIVIPDSIVVIGYEDSSNGKISITGNPKISRCVNLVNIEVNENNQYYKSINGNLYSKDETNLIQYAIGKKDATFEIPSSVTTIDKYAFEYCRSLTEIVIPDSVTSIGKYAFSGCSSLTNIVVPDSVTTIDFDAFCNCTNLTIYCEATEQPSGWHVNWNYNNYPVVWGYTG